MEEEDLITNEDNIKKVKVSYLTFFMYLLIFAGGLMFILTASLDPKQNENLYITAGVLVGVAYVLMIAINNGK
jgi:cell division protein FtsW (lipid II flippase)